MNDRTLVHEEFQVDEMGMHRHTVEEQLVDGNAEHGPYIKIFNTHYIDGNMYKEDIEYRHLEPSFDYYMAKMLCKPDRPKDTVLAIEPYSKRKSEFIAKDEMLL